MYTKQINTNYNYTKIFIKGAGYSILASIVGMFFGYFFRVIIANTLSVEKYGTFYAIVGLFNILAFVSNLGLRAALMKELPAYSAKKEFGISKYLLLTSFWIWFSLSIIVSISAILFSDVIAKYYLKDSSLDSLVVAYSILFLFYPLESLLRSCFFGFQKVEYVSIMDLMKSVLVSLITYIMFKIIGDEIIAPIVAYILTYFIVLMFIGLPLLKKIFPSIITVEQKKEKKSLLSLLKFGAQTCITNIIELVFVYTDTFLITILSSLAEVGYYNVGMPTARILWRLITPLSQVFLPMASLLWSRGEIKKLQQGIQELYHYSLIIMLPSAFVVVFYAKIIIRTLFGVGYLPAVPVLQILAFSSIFCYISKISTTTLMSINRPELVTRITIWSSIVNLIINIMLIPFIGSAGAAIGTLLSFILLTILSQMQLNTQIKVRLNTHKTPRILLSGLIFVASILFFNEFLLPSNIIGSILSITISGALYIGILLLFNCLIISDIKRIYNSVIRKN